MPHVSHTLLPGHRLMVQIQSSWFPLYDRNPQTFVPNIMVARPGGLRAAPRSASTAAPAQASHIVDLPVVPA